MVNAIKENVNAILDGQVINVINFPVMRDAQSTDNVEMVHVYVPEDGTASIVLFVSHQIHYICLQIYVKCFFFQICIIYNFCAYIIWYDKHLNFSEGCENGCGNHGNCVLTNNVYGCECDDGWESKSCSVRLEMECNDEIDNDQGLIIYLSY